MTRDQLTGPGQIDLWGGPYCGLQPVIDRALMFCTVTQDVTVDVNGKNEPRRLTHHYKRTDQVVTDPDRPGRILVRYRYETTTGLDRRLVA